MPIIGSVTLHTDSVVFDGFYLHRLYAHCNGSTLLLYTTRHLSISCSCCTLNLTLFWIRPLNMVPYKPRTRRSLLSCFVALLLLSGDIEPNPGPQFTDNYITLGSLNIRSATSKAALIQNLIYDHNIDIIALQETWFKPDTHPAINQDVAPPGFAVNHVYRQFAAGGPTRGGGLAVIYRDHVKVRPIDLHFQPATFELQSLLISSSTPPVLLVNIYQRHSPPTAVFFDELETLLSCVTVESSARLVLCGDFNCPGNDGRINDNLDDVLTSCGLQQHVLQPTRDHNLLDIVATSDPEVVQDVCVVSSGDASDHCLITAKLQSRQPPPPPVQSTYRALKRLNLGDFEASLRCSALFTDPATTADLFAAQLQSVVTELLDKLAPLKTTRRRASKPTAKWLSADAIAAKRERRRLERVWQRTRTETDRIAYRAVCRRANVLINGSRRDYIRRELDACTDSQQRWTTVKRILHSSNSKKSILDNVDSNLCDKFSDFFMSKVTQLRHNISSRLSSQPTEQLPADPSHSGPILSTLSIVTVKEVYDLLSSIRPKSSSMDFIPTTLLKSCPSVFSDLIAKLANLSFQEGCFPQAFKTAAVTPLIKKPNLDPCNLANFRPISNLNNISKIIERLFLTRLQPQVLTSPNFNPFQSAYRRNHSTETALLCTLDQVFHSADLGKSTILVSLDLSAAFDTIDHTILLNRLQTTFGITGTALNWITSYLSNRFQLVRLDKFSSSPQVCKSGVPQGSVLGPLLFTIYVSPISSLLSNLGVSQHQYADDTQLHISVSKSSASADLRILESALCTLSSWFAHNWLALNPEKSDAILLGTHQRNSTLASVTGVNVSGSTVPLSDHIKLLGVTLDKSLTLRKHVNLVSQSCYYHIKALRHIRHSLDSHTASLIAHALVSSRLDYANSVLYGSPNSAILKLQRIQNTLARIVLNTNSLTHSDPLLKQLHWLPIQSRIHFKLASITYKALSTSTPQYLATFLLRYHPIRTLRSSDQQLLVVPASHTNFGSRSFRHTAPSIWNEIPLQVRSAPSIASFKHSLKTLYFCHPPA